MPGERRNPWYKSKEVIAAGSLLVATGGAVAMRGEQPAADQAVVVKGELKRRTLDAARVVKMLSEIPYHPPAAGGSENKTKPSHISANIDSVPSATDGQDAVPQKQAGKEKSKVKPAEMAGKKSSPDLVVVAAVNSEAATPETKAEEIDAPALFPTVFFADRSLADFDLAEESDSRGLSVFTVVPKNKEKQMPVGKKISVCLTDSGPKARFSVKDEAGIVRENVSAEEALQLVKKRFGLEEKIDLPAGKI